MLINFSNHPYRYWDDRQREASRCYGDVVDLPFPDVVPRASNHEHQTSVQTCVEKIVSMGDSDSITVHVMGEMTFTFMVVTRLKEIGVRCIAS